MSPGSPSIIYDNYKVQCKAKKRIPRIETKGLALAEVPEGYEFETYFWVAEELVKSGYADYSDEALSSNEWTQVHFKERLNPAGPPNPMLEDFYARAYISFRQVMDADEKNVSLNRMRARYRDVLESRIGRISRLASAESLSPIRALTPEETKLYEELHRVIAKWRAELREMGEQ
jgi:hypothetical protein